MALRIIDVYPKKAQFLQGELIGIAVELENNTDISVDCRIKGVVSSLAHEIESYELEECVAAHETKTVEISVNAKNDDFKGYGIDVYVYVEEERAHRQVMSSAFDVVSNWRKSPRYGFLSDFYSEEAGVTADVESLSKLHINLVQFYDWMYKHDQLVPPVTEYTDMMGRTLNKSVVQEKIDLCHQFGMKAFAYGAVYAASKDYFDQHPEEALYYRNGQVIDFIEIFHIMNISADSPWRKHIIGQYREAIEQMDFDGIHMDTYGAPKTAVSGLDKYQQVVRLEEHFPGLINATRQVLEQSREDVGLIFNNVGNWPVDKVAQAEQDAVYIEVWEPYDRYHHIQQIIAWAKHYSGSKPVILAAYLTPFRVEGKETLSRAHHAALLLTAVIASNGGYHLLLGEKGGVLTQAYYADYSVMDECFMRSIRTYYDFFIRYANLFYDDELRDVSMTHLKGDNLEYQLENVSYSTYGEPNKVWAIVKEKPGVKAISLINLTGNADDRWNEGKEAPELVKDISVKIQVEEPVRNIFVASPDRHMGRPQPIGYEIVTKDKREFAAVVIPELAYWEVLVVELG